MNIDTLITLGYYVSSIGFLIATIITFITIRRFGQSSLASIFSYLLIGTGIFFIITIFQKLGADFFMVSDESMDIWWHVMFYMALISYYFGFKALIGLGSEENANSGVIGSEKKWGIIAAVLLIIIFIIPSWAESTVQIYSNSALATFGLHHFLAFLISGAVGYYLLSAKKNLGQIGKAIANPMIIAVVALSIQHLWELFFESWKIVVVTSEVGEGIEKIFLIIASIAIISAASRLKSFAR